MNGNVADAASAVDDTAQPQDTQTEQQDAPASTAREAVERALAKVEETPKADAPPEKTEKAEAKVVEKGRTHGPDGKFTAKPKDGEPEVKTEAKPDANLKSDTQQEPEQKPQAPEVGTPPQRFAKPAQDAWKDTPEPVRIETERAITELTAGLEKYKPAAEAFESVAQFAQMAEQSGTTLAEALTNYTGIERMMLENPVNGIATICRNMNLDRQKVAQALLQMQGNPAPMPQQTQTVPEIAELKKQFQDFTSQFTASQAQAKIDAFAGSHPYFAELENDIANMLETGFAKTLEDAYDKAKRLNPAIAAKIEAEANPTTPKHQPDPAQTQKKAALSPSGAPSNGSDPSVAKPSSSPREALERAFASI